MRTKCWLMLIVVFCSAWSVAQTIEKVFLDMPFALNPILDAQQRLELLEYAKAGMADSIVNKFGAWSYMPEVDTKRGYLRFSLAKGTEMELLLVRQPNDSVCHIGMIETVCAPICSSIVSLYDTAWNKLPVQLPDFEAVDFINTEACRTDSVPLEEVINLLPAYFVQAHFAAGSNDIIFSNETIQQLPPDKQKRYRKYLCEKRVKVF